MTKIPHPFSLIAFICLSFIASGKQKKINFSIKVPLGSDPGSHYAGLVVEPIQSALGQTNITARVALLVLLQVAGTVAETLKITRWKAVKKLIFVLLRF